VGLVRRLLVFVVALAGLVDGGLIVGGPLAAWLAPGPLIGYLPITLLFLGAAFGAGLAATIAANVLFRTSRGRYLPVLAVTTVGGVALALAEVWLEQHWLSANFRTQPLLATAVLITVIATVGATVIRTPIPGPGRRQSAVMIGAIVVLVILASLLSLIVYSFASTLSTFG
jgi:hypothetical protein